MPIVPSFTAEYLVHGYDCGYGGPLRPLALFDFLQESAGAHAERLGIGMTRMFEAGKTWMISRIDLRVERLPFAGETVRVETWPAGRERLFALRDFVMRDAGGEVLVRAVYAYLIIDIAARKPFRPERFFGEAEPIGAEPHPIADHGFSVPALPPPLTGEAFAFAQRACPRHLDNNGHVNNAHIVNWLVDAVPTTERGAGGLSWLRIEFAGEILEGQVLEARAGRDLEGRAILSELRRGEETVARAASIWNS